MSGDGSPKNNTLWNGLDLTWHPKLRPAAQAVSDWYNRGQGALVLAGNPGCGKTHIAKVVYNKYGGPGFALDWSRTPVESVRNAVLYAEPEMFAEIREGYGGNSRQTEAEIIRACQRAKLFVLDDLGVAHIRDESARWAQDIYWRLFDARAEKFTLITTNLRAHEWMMRIGQRAQSRLMQALGSDAAIIDLFDVPDYRQRSWNK